MLFFSNHNGFLADITQYSNLGLMKAFASITVIS